MKDLQVKTASCQSLWKNVFSNVDVHSGELFIYAKNSI